MKRHNFITVDIRLLHGFSYCMKYYLHHNFSSTCLVLLILMSQISNAVAIETPDLTRQNIIVPEKIAGVKTVNAEQVISELTSDDPPILIDARIKQDREYGYIESSIGLPDIETNCQSLSKITADKDHHLMFYCNGVLCGRSVVAIKVARSCGYHNLSWFKGGFAEWNEKGYQYIKNR
ncbi:MAG TPA: rhodanese-like domain-containing protein [Gammaproteobacteria bacterium]|nr:rhodanese-like domain-containing protein [Gammaproteobacteria bacterium]